MCNYAMHIFSSNSCLLAHGWVLNPSHERPAAAKAAGMAHGIGVMLN